MSFIANTARYKNNYKILKYSETEGEVKFMMFHTTISQYTKNRTFTLQLSVIRLVLLWSRFRLLVSIWTSIGTSIWTGEDRSLTHLGPRSDQKRTKVWPFLDLGYILNFQFQLYIRILARKYEYQKLTVESFHPPGCDNDSSLRASVYRKHPSFYIKLMRCFVNKNWSLYRKGCYVGQAG